MNRFSLSTRVFGSIVSVMVMQSAASAAMIASDSAADVVYNDGGSLPW